MSVDTNQSVTNISDDYEDYYYDYDPTFNTNMEELVVPLLVYSITFTIGLVGNILILVAVRGQTQVSGGLFGFSFVPGLTPM